MNGYLNSSKVRKTKSMLYENIRRVCYGDGMQFVPVCTKCRQFVKADKQIRLTKNGQPDGPNATCSKCGRVQMIFGGYY